MAESYNERNPVSGVKKSLVDWPSPEEIQEALDWIEDQEDSGEDLPEGLWAEIIKNDELDAPAHAKTVKELAEIAGVHKRTMGDRVREAVESGELIAGKAKREKENGVEQVVPVYWPSWKAIEDHEGTK